MLCICSGFCRNNMQCTSAAQGSGWASKEIVWLLITMQHISNQYNSLSGTYSVKVDAVWLALLQELDAGMKDSLLPTMA